MNTCLRGVDALRLIRRVHLRVVFLVTLVAAVGVRPVSAQTLASYQFSSGGWATFGLALPSGAAPAAVKVGTFPTQTDVKTRWPDGSIRFAVVTANIQAPGTYPIAAGAVPGGSLTPVWPTASVKFVIAGTTYTATLPSFNSTDSWLTGALVREARVVAVPTGSAGADPLLQVIFDVRSYASGGHRVDITVQNVRDVAAMDKVTYDLTVTVAGTVVLTKSAFTHYAFTRWRKTFATGLTEATVIPDFEPFYASAALPRYLSTVNNQSYDTSTAAWDINGFGSMNPLMDAAGGRPELAPYPDWQAQYMVRKSASQRNATLLNGNNSGSWCLHILKADGVSLIKVTETPFYWASVSHEPGYGPLVPRRPDGQWRGMRLNVAGGYSDIETRVNEEHAPNLTYFPYLLTGDRYYLDQTKIWAAYWAINCWPVDPAFPEPVLEPLFNRSRGGSLGRVWKTGLGRELGHPFEIIILAAMATPDADADQAYFRTLVQNQLDGLGDYAVRTSLPGGIAQAMYWEGGQTQLQGAPPGRYTSLWRLSYTAFAIDLAAQQGLWTMGDSLEFAKRAVRCQLGFINNGTTGGEKVPNYPAIATTTNNDTTITFFSDWATLLAWNRTNWSGMAFPSTPVGLYGAEANVMLTVGRRLAVPGVEAAYQWFISYSDQYGTVLGDLNTRSGYALSGQAGLRPASNVVVK
jgi:hypothetical protein